MPPTQTRTPRGLLRQCLDELGHGRAERASVGGREPTGALQRIQLMDEAPELANGYGAPAAEFAPRIPRSSADVASNSRRSTRYRSTASRPTFWSARVVIL
jgi:hypothetical protein